MGKNVEWPKMAVSNCSQQFFPKKDWNKLEWPKMAIPNFSNNFSKMTGHSEFLPKGLVQIWNGQKWTF